MVAFAAVILAVGESNAVMYDITELCASLLPADRPRYLMGVGKPTDLVESVARGVDLFDCVLPTRLARNGAVWSDREGTRLDLARRALLQNTGPIMAECVCSTCEEWPLGVVAALYQAREPLAFRLASIHNLALLNQVLRDIRNSVLYTAMADGLEA